jgi:hypothetical protein
MSPLAHPVPGRSWKVSTPHGAETVDADGYERRGGYFVFFMDDGEEIRRVPEDEVLSVIAV